MRHLYVLLVLAFLLPGCSLDLDIHRKTLTESLPSLDGGSTMLLPEQAKATGFYPGTMCSRVDSGSAQSSACFNTAFNAYKSANPVENKRALEFATSNVSGSERSCFLTTTQEVYCDDANKTYYQVSAIDLSAITAKTNLHSLSVSEDSACILDDNGKPYCWGWNNGGRLGIGGTVEDRFEAATAVDVSGVMAGKTLVSVTASRYHGCALDSAGSAYCWGMQTNGRLGDGVTASTRSYSARSVISSGVLSGKTLASIAAGAEHTCALDTLGAAYCWGMGTAGQLGRNSTTASNVPVNVTATGVLSGKVLEKISGGYMHTCTLDNAGVAYCWGSNNKGQLGNNSTTNSLVPVAVNTAGVLSGKVLVSISAGFQATCAADTDGQQYCWGEYFGTVPVAISQTGFLVGRKVLSSAVGGFRSYGLLDDGRIAMWANDDLTFPLLHQGMANFPFAGKTVLRITQNFMSSAMQYCVLVKENSDIYCWGSNSNGEVGNGRSSVILTLVPEKVDRSGVLNGKTLVSLVSGTGFNCALDDQGQAYCWGVNYMGQLGDGTTNSSTVPVAVKNTGVLLGKKLVSLQSGTNHVCGVTEDYSVFCWGGNANGEVGDGTGVDAYEPVAIDMTALTGKSITALYIRGDASCILDEDGKAYCWGSNSQSRLGVGLDDGTDAFYTALSPTAVKADGALTGKKLKFITMTEYGACALDTDGAAYCWGSNGYGTLDAATMGTNIKEPLAMNFSVPVSVITVGSFHGCFISTSNDLYCWGENTAGQLGWGSLWNGKQSAGLVDTSALPGIKFKGLVAGDYSQCALSTTDKTYCWGDTNLQILTPTEIQ